MLHVGENQCLKLLRHWKEISNKQTNSHPQLLDLTTPSPESAMSRQRDNPCPEKFDTR